MDDEGEEGMRFAGWMVQDPTGVHTCIRCEPVSPLGERELVFVFVLVFVVKQRKEMLMIRHRKEKKRRRNKKAVVE